MAPPQPTAAPLVPLLHANGHDVYVCGLDEMHLVPRVSVVVCVLAKQELDALDIITEKGGFPTTRVEVVPMKGWANEPPTPAELSEATRYLEHAALAMPGQASLVMCKSGLNRSVTTALFYQLVHTPYLSVRKAIEEARQNRRGILEDDKWRYHLTLYNIFGAPRLPASSLPDPRHMPRKPNPNPDPQRGIWLSSGCGAGADFFCFEQSEFNWSKRVGVDPSEEQLAEFCRRQMPNQFPALAVRGHFANLHKMDLPVPPSFVTCTFSMHFAASHLKQAVRSLTRTVVQGCVLAVVVPNSRAIRYALDAGLEKRRRLFSSGRTKEIDDTEWFTLEEVSEQDVRFVTRNTRAESRSGEVGREPLLDPVLLQRELEDCGWVAYHHPKATMGSWVTDSAAFDPSTSSLLSHLYAGSVFVLESKPPDEHIAVAEVAYTVHAYSGGIGAVPGSEGAGLDDTLMRRCKSVRRYFANRLLMSCIQEYGATRNALARSMKMQTPSHGFFSLWPAPEEAVLYIAQRLEDIRLPDSCRRFHYPQGSIGRFRLPLPFSYSRKVLGQKSRGQPMAATRKADGVHVVLIGTPTGTFAFFRCGLVTQTGLPPPPRVGHLPAGTVIEGELCENGSFVFAFDLLASIEHHVNATSDWRSRYDALQQLLEAFPGPMACKQWLEGNPEPEVLTSRNQGVVPIASDGLILKVVHSPPFVPDIKWKHGEDTIDLKVHYEDAARGFASDSASRGFRIKGAEGNFRDTDPGSCIMEFGNLGEDIFDFVRRREDKTHANALQTVLSCIQAARETDTVEDLKELLLHGVVAEVRCEHKNTEFSRAVGNIRLFHCLDCCKDITAERRWLSPELETLKISLLEDASSGTAQTAKHHQQFSWNLLNVLRKIPAQDLVPGLTCSHFEQVMRVPPAALNRTTSPDLSEVLRDEHCKTAYRLVRMYGAMVL